MAKNVSADPRFHPSAGGEDSPVAQAPTSGALGVGFKKSYSDEKWNRIVAGRQAMRQRLVADD